MPLRVERWMIRSSMSAGCSASPKWIDRSVTRRMITPCRMAENAMCQVRSPGSAPEASA
jgi:hypothetical protein